MNYFTTGLASNLTRRESKRKKKAKTLVLSKLEPCFTCNKVVETIQDRVGEESFIISIGDLDPVRAAGGSLA